MKKISITFNSYEYDYIKYAHDTASENEFVNVDIKDILYSFVIYTKSKIHDKRHLIRLTNIFLIKANDKPLEVEETDTSAFTKVKEIYMRTKKDSVIRSSTIYTYPILYVLRLDSKIMEYLDEIKSEILKKAPQLKEPNYSELIRNCVHFVIDNMESKIHFFSILYLVRLVPYTNLVNVTNMLVFLDENEKKLKNVEEVYKTDEVTKISKISEVGRVLEADYQIYKKLQKWISNSKLNENLEAYDKISKEIGFYARGYSAVSSFIDFVFFIAEIYHDLSLSEVELAHFYYDDTVTSFLARAKYFYINIMDKMYITLFFFVIGDKNKEFLFR